MNEYYITRNLDQFLTTYGCEFLKQVIQYKQYEEIVSKEEFQVWRLKRKHKSKFILILDDGNYNVIKKLTLTMPDCKINKLKLYFENNVLCFPNER